MIKIDPIIAVKDVAASADWYQELFGWRKKHGGHAFAVLVSGDDDILLCLHQWGEHEHPTMADPTVTAGNGLILYFRTDNMNAIRQKAAEAGLLVEEEVHVNPNSLKREFSLRDPDGYFLTITEFHQYKG